MRGTESWRCRKRIICGKKTSRETGLHSQSHHHTPRHPQYTKIFIGDTRTHKHAPPKNKLTHMKEELENKEWKTPEIRRERHDVLSELEVIRVWLLFAAGTVTGAMSWGADIVQQGSRVETGRLCLGHVQDGERGVGTKTVQREKRETDECQPCRSYQRVGVTRAGGERPGGKAQGAWEGCESAWRRPECGKGSRGALQGSPLGLQGPKIWSAVGLDRSG